MKVPQKSDTFSQTTRINPEQEFDFVSKYGYLSFLDTDLVARRY